MATSSTIADKIQNDFLNCKICLATFKQPKMLPCLHTYCLECLEDLTKDDKILKCPECREIVDLSGGISKLKTNFHINSLLDIFQSPEKKELTCSLCPPGHKGKNPAVVKCGGCSNYMCQACGDRHQSTHPTHMLVNLAGSSLDETDIEVMMRKKIYCQIHPNDRVSYYCNTCDCVICSKCYSYSCIKHQRLGLVEAAKAKKLTVRKLLERLGSDIQLHIQREGDLNEAMDKVKAIECSIISSIENTLTEVLNNLFKQGEAIKKTVSDYVKKQEESYAAAKSTLQLQKKKAQDTKEYCARVISTSDAKEILCLKSIIEDQISALQALSSLNVNKPSPKVTVNKSVKDMISQCHLFNITYGEEPVSESQQSPSRTEQLKQTQAYLPIAQPKEKAIRKYFFDTNLDDDSYDPKLTGVSISGDGDIIVADEENSLLKCYLDNGLLKTTISLPDEDEDPCSVAVCDDIIACSAKNRLYLLEMDGSLVKKLFLRGSESVYPIAAYEDEYVAVSEGTLCSISLYDLNGYVVSRVKPQGYEGIRFLFIAINSEEEFIVSDCGKKCVVIFNRSEEIIAICNESCVNGLTVALNPFSVCVDGNDNIYVTEPSRILLFSPTGVFKDQLLSTADGLHKPRVIAIDQDDNLIITQGNGYVCVYELNLD
ncbi:E3 ubiquitin-protein ligase TRIM56-like [Carcharodon carcharias]|uniref:E3 ubiquitin-protein ligase TRIM56-like n=1 Tax=Carcharodon carcharias TaxID=13397 RepID=UPI001B7EBDA9|nr:E3 ubiquitin-protein ligase TRIM56-like [Carcharodon carcharias]XP_041033854.1 E3 ubiquitin-protein ligase TRIM56-like [Carcharodon carcharias]